MADELPFPAAPGTFYVCCSEEHSNPGLCGTCRRPLMRLGRVEVLA